MIIWKECLLSRKIYYIFKISFERNNLQQYYWVFNTFILLYLISQQMQVELPIENKIYLLEDLRLL